MKVLILSTGTGEGHNSAGKALKEEFDRLNVECQMLDVLNFASKNASTRGKKIYIWSTVKAKKVFKSAYKAGRLLSNSKLRSPVYYANSLYSKKLCAYIKENNFDTIVMPHLFPAEALTYLIRNKYLTVKTYFIATDYTCIPFTEETRADYYFIPHVDLKDEFIKRGIPEKKLVCSGIPVSRKFSSDILKNEAKEKLNMPLDKKIILLMTGSMGFGNIESLSYKLVSRMDKNTCLYIMGGSNEKLKEQLRKAFKEENRVVVLDYTNDTYLYMKASDVLFTKPGGLTSSEALSCNIPLVFTSPIPGCENKNIDFFTSHNMSIYDKNEDKLVLMGLELLNNKDKQKEMINNQRNNSNPNAALDICNFIVLKGKENV